MRYDPTRPLHERYRIDHRFLSAGLGREVEIISRLVNAFFLWELNSCETIVKNGEARPIDFANAVPDLSLISLHYYFPWAIKTLAKWCIFCTVTRRKMAIDGDIRTYFAVADTPEMTYEQKLDRYEVLSNRFFDVERYAEFCGEHLPHIDEAMLELVDSREFDRLVVDTAVAAFPRHEHEQLIAHYRGLVAAWTRDQASSP
jgi:hypothetical protein